MNRLPGPRVLVERLDEREIVLDPPRPPGHGMDAQHAEGTEVVDALLLKVVVALGPRHQLASSVRSLKLKISLVHIKRFPSPSRVILSDFYQRARSATADLGEAVPICRWRRGKFAVPNFI